MSATPERKLAAIMMADIAGFSALMERDESGTFNRVRTLRDALINPKVAEHGGRVIKTTGDGFLAEFPSATAALQCAITLQRHNQSREESRPADERIHMRIGINVGDIIIDGADVAGDGVVIAARLEPLAPKDGICVSATVREHIRQELGVEYEDLGEQHVKNISRPIRAYRIALAGKESIDVKGAGVVPRPGSSRTSKRGRLIAAVGALVAIAGAAALYVGVRPNASGGTTSVANDTRMTFAIMPISAPVGDKEAAAFASSLTEAFVTRQTNSPWSRAASFESVETALKKYSSPRDVGRAVNARYVVRGQVTRKGARLPASVSIIDAESEKVLGAREVLWPVGRPVYVDRPEIDGAIGGLARYGYLLELAQTRLKRDTDLDARDLTYLAWDAWKNTKESYDTAMPLLRRAMALAPEDRLTLMVVTRVNLCECRRKWSKTPEAQERIGEDALERYLNIQPRDRPMLLWKVYVHELHRRHEDAIVILDRLLERSPDDPELLKRKSYELLKLGRDKEALGLVLRAEPEDKSWVSRMIASAAYFKVGKYADSASYAQKAIAEMDKTERSDDWAGQTLLIRTAAEASQGRMAQAKSALDDFNAAVPQVRTVSQIKAWMDPRAEIAGYDPLYVALRRAGIPD